VEPPTPLSFRKQSEMVAPAFGFSVGDFINVIQVLVEVFNGFKEVGGSSTKYASEAAFLGGLSSTLVQLEKHVATAPQDDISEDILKLVDVIKGPLEEFRKFLEKYNSSLGTTSTKSKVSKAPKTVEYTVNILSGKVERLRRQIDQPLQAVNSLLSLRVM
jgi:hypothetical protein